MSNEPSSLVARVFARVFRPIAKVEPDEALTAAVMTLTVFAVMTAYYFLKTAREPLILLHGGAEVKSYAAAGQALLLIVVVRAYSWLASRVGRMRLLATVYLFFVSNLVVFAVLQRAHVNIGVAFYLWVGIFNMTAVAQFWGYAADIYTPEQGKRLFAILGVGATSGAVAGARIAKEAAALGPQGLMILAAILLVGCVGLFWWVEKRSVVSTSAMANAGETAKKKEEPLAHEGAFSLIMRDKYLLLIGALVLILNWCNTNGEYLLDRTLLASLGDARARGIDPEKFVGAFKADYFGWVNLIGMLLQLFAVSRIFDKFGVRVALFFLPGVAFIGYSFMLVTPILSLVRIAKIAENSLDYSVQKTSLQALFLVSSRIEKYVGKTAIDTLILRIGDVFSAGLVWIGGVYAFSTATFAGINLALITVWLVLVVFIGREHARRSGESEEELALEPRPVS